MELKINLNDAKLQIMTCYFIIGKKIFYVRKHGHVPLA